MYIYIYIYNIYTYIYIYMYIIYTYIRKKTLCYNFKFSNYERNHYKVILLNEFKKVAKMPGLKRQH